MSPEAIELERLLRDLFDPPAARVTFLTGAGVSAESGIPTFRGPEGYWRRGSRSYRPEALATRAAFERDPTLVWSWYLHRLDVCRRAQPNAAHFALARACRELGDRALLVTQNVDGLHRRAGHPPESMYEVHGNIARMRCRSACGGPVDIPDRALPAGPTEATLTAERREALRCQRCGELTRPHVLWFDECYDEAWYRFDSSLRAAQRTDLLVVVGTTGATALPMRVVREASSAGAALLVIDPAPNPLSELAERSARGVRVLGTAGLWVPAFVELTIAASEGT